MKNKIDKGVKKEKVIYVFFELDKITIAIKIQGEIFAESLTMDYKDRVDIIIKKAQRTLSVIEDKGLDFFLANKSKAEILENIKLKQYKIYKIYEKDPSNTTKEK